MTALPSASIPALSTSPTVIVSGDGNPAITSVLCMIDSSAGGGVTLPQNTDAWNYGTPGTPLWGLEAPMPVRLISLGPCDIAVNAFTGDAAPPIAILKAFTAVDYIPGGSGGTWACIRVW